ncbi:hypothetical protein LMH44_10990, partial [Neisseria gonorrhoeae]|uniref:hypothetical protein n=1 Tax=Neisseria gonorrhoeae TaxID=485 RepID=UPI001E3B8436
SGSAAWNFTIGTIGVSLNAIASDNIVNATENADPIIFGGTVTGHDTIRAALVQGDFTVTLTPQGGGTPVNVTITSYSTTDGK